VHAFLEASVLKRMVEQTPEKHLGLVRSLKLDPKCFEKRVINFTNPHIPFCSWFISSRLFAAVNKCEERDVVRWTLEHSIASSDPNSSSISLFDDPSSSTYSSLSSPVTETSTSTSTSTSFSPPTLHPGTQIITVNDHSLSSEENEEDENSGLRETFDNIQQTPAVEKPSSQPRVMSKTPSTNARRTPYSFRDRSSTKRISTQFSHLIIDKENEDEDFECEYEIEDVIARRINPTTNVYEYEVKWKEYKQTTWEPRSKFDFDVDAKFGEQ